MGSGVTVYREFELFVSDTVVGDGFVIQFLVNYLCGAISENWSSKRWIEICSGMRTSYGISEIVRERSCRKRKVKWVDGALFNTFNSIMISIINDYYKQLTQELSHARATSLSEGASHMRAACGSLP